MKEDAVPVRARRVTHGVSWQVDCFCDCMLTSILSCELGVEHLPCGCDCAGPGGHILVFLSGLSEMEIVEGHLRKLGNSATNTGPLQGAQLRIEKLHSSMRTSLERVRVSDAVVIYLSTNIAESSVTIDGLGVVIDYGVHKRLLCLQHRYFAQL